MGLICTDYWELQEQQYINTYNKTITIGLCKHSKYQKKSCWNNVLRANFRVISKIAQTRIRHTLYVLRWFFIVTHWPVVTAGIGLVIVQRITMKNSPQHYVVFPNISAHVTFITNAKELSVSRCPSPGGLRGHNWVHFAHRP